MEAEILIKVKMKHIIDGESLEKEYNGSLDKCVRWLIKEEGHFIGMIEDEFEIVSVERT